MIDAYEVLDVGLDADEEELKKAFRRLSLRLHPDKAKQHGLDPEEANRKFNDIKVAHDILKDADRRKAYDTLGLDLGEEKPDSQVWNMGSDQMLGPMAAFVLKVFVMRLLIWSAGWRYIGYLIFLVGFIVAGLYGANVTIKGKNARSEEGQPFVLGAGVVFVLTVVLWIWPVLADTMGIVYLANEVVPVITLIESWKIGAGAAAGCLFVSWLLQNWWFWILAVLAVLLLIVLMAVALAHQLVTQWIDVVKMQHGDKLKEWRLRMRRERKAMQDEVAELKTKLQERGGTKNSANASTKPSRI